jgi:L-amino acid N-acyltransferase YncA
MRIRAAAPDDAAAIAGIYAPYVTGTAVSFETEPPDSAEMGARIAAGGALYPWLAAEDEAGGLLGYASAAPFRARAAYRFTVETSVYLRNEACGRGLGRALYEPLLATLEAQGFTQAIGAIALPNEASVRLHERLGFVHAGTYRRVGWKLGAWWDVGLWQRPLAAPQEPPPEPRPFSRGGGSG